MANELDTAEQLHQQAIELCEQGNYKKALPLLHQVISLTKKVQRADRRSRLESGNFEHANLDAHMAVLRRCVTLRQGVRERLEGILSLLEQRPEQAELGQCLHSLAELYRTEHLYDKALPLYQRTLALWEQTLDPEHPDLIECLTHVAYLLRTQDKEAEVRPLLERVLPLQEKRLGSEHPDVAETLSSLASVYSKQGDQAKAAACYERALAILENVCGADDTRTVHTIGSLAYVYQMQGEFATALPLYERFLIALESQTALVDKRLAEIGRPSTGENPIVAIYRKNRDICLAGMQQTA